MPNHPACRYPGGQSLELDFEPYRRQYRSMTDLPLIHENFELTRSPLGCLASFDAAASDTVREFFSELQDWGAFRLSGSDLAVIGANGRAILVFPGAATICSDWPDSALPTILLCLDPADSAAPWAKALPWMA